MDILQLVGVMFNVCHLGQGVDTVLALYTVTLVLSVTERGLLKSPTKIVDLCCPFNSSQSFFKYFEVLGLDAYTFRIIMSSQ